MLFGTWLVRQKKAHYRKVFCSPQRINLNTDSDTNLLIYNGVQPAKKAGAVVALL